MHWQKGWYRAGLLGVLVVGMAVIPPVFLGAAEAQTQSSPLATGCTEQRGQILERLARNLIYRSQQYARSGQFDLAARSLDLALHPTATVADPFAKTDLVANIAGETGEQPSTMEQLVTHAIATQQQDKLLELLPRVVQAAQTLKGEYGVMNVKRAIFIQLAHYYAQLQQPTQARSLLAQARQLLNSLQGDGFGLIAAPVAEGYVALGEKQTAIEILNQALQQTEAMKSQDPAYLGDIFSTIATAYARADAEQSALQVAKRIKLPEVQAKTLAAIASRSAQVGRSAQATALLAQALNLTRSLPGASRSSALSQIAPAYAQVGQWETALKLVDTIATAESKVRTLAKLAALSDRANRPAIRAKLLSSLAASAQTIVPFYDGDTLLRQIFAEYLANRQYALAFQFSQRLDGTLQQTLLLQLIQQASLAREFAIARQALAALPSGWKNQTRSLGWRSIATGYAEAGQFEPAIPLLSQIEDTSDYPSHVLTRVAIAQAYRKTGQTKRALEQLNQALQALQRLDNSVAKLEPLSQIAVQFAQLGQPNRAVEVQTQALNLAKAPTPNTPSVSYIVEQVVTQYLRAEQYALALQLVRTLENEYEHDRLLQTILQQMLEVGELSSVQQAAVEIRNSHQKIAFWVTLADYYRARGQAKSAIAILAQAFAIAQTLPGPDENDRTEAARLDPSIPIQDDFDRGSLIESIAIRYTELGQPDLARQTAQALRLPADRQRLMQRLVCYQ